jgi:hypothetical protein
MTGKDKWLRARQKHLTATAVPLLFGFNKFKSIRDLIDEKILGITKEPPLDSIHIRRGKILECAVLEALSFDIGLTCETFSADLLRRKYPTCALGFESSPTKYDAYFFNDEFGLGATPDAFNKKDLSQLIECKAPQSAKMSFWREAPPIDYLVQCHVQMAVVPETDNVILGALFASSNLALLAWRINKNKEITSIIIQETQRFWKEREQFEVDYIKSGELFQKIKESYNLIHYKE